jgi:NAD(P)-dependent dehydrogenase (short-subunit alcohol dehydrogenase family)
MEKLQGKVALLAGASKGIGAVIVNLLASGSVQ